MTGRHPARRRAGRRGALGVLVAMALLLTGCSSGVLPAPTAASDARKHVMILTGSAIGYCAHRPLEEWPASVTRVVVAVHGMDRNACGMLASVTEALGGEASGEAPTVAVIAPVFSTWLDAAPGGHVWDARGWPAGDASSTGASSYQVMDDLIEAVGDRKVTLVGFSGGGQFVNRYASVSPRAAHRYVVVNPSSYLWFTPDRPTSDPCREANRWRYGLDERYGYAAESDADTIRARYATRDVRYFIGTNDNDPRSLSMDRSCGAMAQGSNRGDRAVNYHRHLIEAFGEAIDARQPLTVVPGVGHDARAMLVSPEARAALTG
ncbi:MAG: alpha/beta hydrolase [Propioniciclava sp.]|uniref:hypothetical protein n=1 Tax=Propioniciclava sp. TaxID=2038686 RepID=UPI0039E2A817